MTHLVPVLRPVLGSPFRRAGLYRAAGEIPSWHIAPVRTGTVTDLISGSNIITFTNSSPAWGFNGSGVLVQPAANVPFIEYDPATGSALGWRVWDAVTNNWNYTEDFTNSYWTKAGGSITANVGPSPDGGTNADGFVETTGVSETHGFQRNYPFVAGTQVTQSVFVSKGSRNFAVIAFGTGAFGGTTTQAFFDLTLGTITQAANCTAQVQVCSNGILRCSITVTPTVTTTSTAAYRVTNASGSSIYTGNGSTAAYFWGAQINTGPLAPYVPATGAVTASSTADVASISGAAFAGIWNAAESTIVCKFLSDNTAGSGGTSLLFDVGAGGAFGTTGYGSFVTSGWFINPSTPPMNLQSSVAASAGTKAIGTMAARFKANDSRIAVNGTLGTLDSSCAVPASPTTLYIGRSGWTGSANYANGYIQEFATLKSGRPDPNLTAISST